MWHDFPSIVPFDLGECWIYNSGEQRNVICSTAVVSSGGKGKRFGSINHDLAICGAVTF